MATPAPALTVVLPVHDGAPWLAAALGSVQAQSFTDWELLAIDDGSSDGSRAILEAFAAADPRIIVTSRPNRGLAATLQEGIERARGELVALMNADDVAHPDRLARQAPFMKAHPHVAALGTQTRLLVDGVATAVESRLPLDPGGCRRLLETAPPLAHPTVMLRRSAVLAVGGYRTRAVVEDWDLWFRLAERHDLANLPEVLLDYRLHDGQFSQTRDERVAVAGLVVKRAAAARRSGRPDPLEASPADRATAERLGIRPAEIVAAARSGALERALQVLAATGSGPRAARELELLGDGWVATADPARFQAARDWLAGRTRLGAGDRLGGAALLFRAACADPVLARRLLTAAGRAVGGRVPRA